MVGWLFGNNADAFICLYAPNMETENLLYTYIYDPATRTQKQRYYGEDGEPHNPCNLSNTAPKAGLERVPHADKGAFTFKLTPC